MLLNLDLLELGHCTTLYSGKIVSVIGHHKLHLHSMWVDEWSVAGGSSLALYLLYCCCDHLENVNVDDINYSDGVDAVCASLQLLSTMMTRSTDLRDEFLQLHGFHVVALSLRKLLKHNHTKVSGEELLGPAIVEQCFALVEVGLGMDAYDGDGAAAALQGLFFDFSLWGSASRHCLALFLRRLAEFVSDFSVTLHRSVGVQRILDVMRLHALRTSPSSVGLEEDLRATADAGYKLLSVALDAALDWFLKENESQNNKIPLFLEAEMILNCIEETTSALWAERLLRCLIHLKDVSPLHLSKAMKYVRFVETTALQLLTRNGYTTEIRRSTVVLLLWILGDDGVKVGEQLISIRDRVVTQATPLVLIDGQTRATSAFEWGGNNDNKVGKSSSAASHPPGKPVLLIDVPRAEEISHQITKIAKPLWKVWESVIRLGDALDKALGGTRVGEGAWNSVNPLYCTHPNNVLSVFDIDGPIGNFEVWQALPIIAGLLRYSTVSIRQTFLASISMIIKTEERQIESFCVLPDRTMIELFLQLEDGGAWDDRWRGDLSGWRPAGIIASFLSSTLKFHNKKMNDTTTQLAEGWTTVDQFGDHAISSEEMEGECTCSELAIDIFTSIISEKMRYHGIDACRTWKEIQLCIDERYCRKLGGIHEQVCHHVLQQTVALSLQKLNKGNDGWNLELLHSLSYLVRIIEEKHLCGVDAREITILPPPHNKNHAVDNLLCDYESPADLTPSPPVRQTLSKEDMHVLYNLLDIMSCLRKSAAGGILGGAENSCVLTSFEILLSCLSRIEADAGDRALEEVISYVTYFTEPWGYFDGGNAFKELMRETFCRLRDVVLDPCLPVVLRHWYETMAFQLIDIFIQYRNDSLKGGNTARMIPPHVLPAIDAIIIAEGVIDIYQVFQMLEISMRAADSIRFDDDSVMVDDSILSQTMQTHNEPVIDLLSDHNFFGGSSHGGNIPEPKPEDIFLSPAWMSMTGTESNQIPSLTIAQQQQQQQLPPPDGEGNSLPTNSNSSALPSSSNSSPDPNDALTKWCQVRRGIVQERVDSERARLSRCMESLDFAAEATVRFWNKLKHKVEAEVFQEQQCCEWKLGVANEGPFPTRRR